MFKKSLLFLFCAITFILPFIALGRDAQPATPTPTPFPTLTPTPYPTMGADCTPSSNQASFFEDPNYEGPCVTLDVGSYHNHGAMPVANDSISSIRMASDVFITVCADGDLKGICNVLYGDTEDLSMYTVGTDTISSFNVQSRTCLPDPDHVALFDEPGYGGNCVLLKEGIYLDASEIGMANDSISSILTYRLKSNVFAALCEHVKLNGVCEAFTRDDLNLGDNQLIKDNMTSSVVVRTNDCYPAPGEVTIFRGLAFSGECVKLPTGDYPNHSAMKVPIYSISSILLSGTVNASICKKVNFVECTPLTANAFNLGQLPVGDDRLSSMKVTGLSS